MNILDDRQYQASQDLFTTINDTIAKLKESLTKQGFSLEEIERIIDPMKFFSQQILADLDRYDQVKSQKIMPTVHHLKEIGLLLIALRIAKGLTYEQLAEKIHLDPHEIRKHELNDYFKINPWQVQGIVEALGAEFSITINLEKSSKD